MVKIWKSCFADTGRHSQNTSIQRVPQDGGRRASTKVHLAHKESTWPGIKVFTFLYQVYLDAEWSFIYLYQCKYLRSPVPAETFLVLPFISAPCYSAGTQWKGWSFSRKFSMQNVHRASRINSWTVNTCSFSGRGLMSPSATPKHATDKPALKHCWARWDPVACSKAMPAQQSVPTYCTDTSAAPYLALLTSKSLITEAALRSCQNVFGVKAEISAFFFSSPFKWREKWFSQILINYNQ